MPWCFEHMFTNSQTAILPVASGGCEATMMWICRCVLNQKRINSSFWASWFRFRIKRPNLHSRRSPVLPRTLSFRTPKQSISNSSSMKPVANWSNMRPRHCCAWVFHWRQTLHMVTGAKLTRIDDISLALTTAFIMQAAQMKAMRKIYQAMHKLCLLVAKNCMLWSNQAVLPHLNDFNVKC